MENRWPSPLEVEERSHRDLVNAYEGGVANLPFAVLRGYSGSDFPRVNHGIQTITCRSTGEVLAATPSVRPHLSVIHAQMADWNETCCCAESFASKRRLCRVQTGAIATVEERVRSLDASPNAYIFFRLGCTAVCGVPRGNPFVCTAYYERDNVFYRAWDQISRNREIFAAWVEQDIRTTQNIGEYLQPQSGVKARAVYL